MRARTFPGHSPRRSAVFTIAIDGTSRGDASSSGGRLGMRRYPDVVAAASRRHARSRDPDSLHRRFKFRRRLLREQARASTQSQRRRFPGRPPSRRNRRFPEAIAKKRRLRKSRTSICRNTSRVGKRGHVIRPRSGRILLNFQHKLAYYYII